MSNIKVPKGMRDSLEDMYLRGASLTEILESALRWLSENPIVPTEEKLIAVITAIGMGRTGESWVQWFTRILSEWQRRMFLAPVTSKVGEFVLCDTCRAKPGSPYLCNGCFHNRLVIEQLQKKV